MDGRAVGQKIRDRYQITHKLNSGGMGSVYAAIDTQLFDQPAAIKVLNQALGESLGVAAEDLRRRFHEEARVSAQLGAHPHIVQLKDYGLDADQPFLVMELLGIPPLTALTLRQLQTQEKVLSPTRVLALAHQICSALHFAHTYSFQTEEHTINGIIHRDLKPSNIMVLQNLSQSEVVKVLDFGVAKLLSDVTVSLGTGTFGFVGTMNYASPEQLRGEELDIRSDIYSFGLILYELLTGKQPLHPTTQSFPGWYEAHNHKQPRQFQELELSYPLPPLLESLILSCLEKGPQDRPATMLELSQALEDSLADPQATTVRCNPIPQQSPPTPQISSNQDSEDVLSTPNQRLESRTAVLSGPKGSSGTPTPEPKPQSAVTPSLPRVLSWLQPLKLWIGAGISFTLVLGILGGVGVWLLTRPTDGMWVRDWLLPLEDEDYLSQRELRDELEVLTAELLDEADDAYLYIERGYVHFQLQQGEQAFADFSEALEQDPDLPDPYLGLGAVYLSRGQFGEALRQIEQALEIDPGHPDAIYYRGLAKVGQGDHLAGIQDLEQAAFLFEQDDNELGLYQAEDILSDVLEMRLFQIEFPSEEEWISDPE